MQETNPINEEVKEIRDSLAGDADLTDPNLVAIVRLRLVSDPGFPWWDLSYCYGRMRDGSYVRVHLPWHQFSKKFLKRDLVEMCRKEGVYAKGLGLLDEGVLSKLT